MSPSSGNLGSSPERCMSANVGLYTTVGRDRVFCEVDWRTGALMEEVGASDDGVRSGVTPGADRTDHRQADLGPARQQVLATPHGGREVLGPWPGGCRGARWSSALDSIGVSHGEPCD